MVESGYLITQLEFVDSFLSSGQIFSIVLNLRQNDIGILEGLEILFGVLGVGKVWVVVFGERIAAKD